MEYLLITDQVHKPNHSVHIETVIISLITGVINTLEQHGLFLLDI